MVNDDYPRRSCEFHCGWILKVLIILIASAGIACSFFASWFCRFLYFRSDAFDEIDASLSTNQTEGWIGIFKHGMVIDDDPSNVTHTCLPYDTILDLRSSNEALFSSQLCAILAPSLACIAILVSIVELLCCRFHGSFTIASILFLAASLFQTGTLAIFLVERSICLEPGGCEIGKAAYWNASASFAYFSACVLLCCSPRPTPCMQNDHHHKRSDDELDDEIVYSL